MLPAISIKRLRSSRSLRLRVYPDGQVVVTAPLRAPQALIDSFVTEHQDWITQKHEVAIQNRAALTQERETIFFRGTEYQLRVNVNSQLKSAVSLDDTQLIVTSPNESDQEVRKILEKWYRAAAKRVFTARVPLLADLVNRDVTRVTIRSQRSRWGSCSSRNTISLNWRLIMAPDWVSDYVIYHELAHLTQMNHSPKFWQLVEDYYPEYKKAEKWLKNHHQLLHF